MKSFLFIIVALSILFISIGFFGWQSNTGAVDLQDKTSRTFVVKQGESVKSIAARLEEEGLIKNQLVFTLLIRIMGLQSKIQAGDFKLSPSFTASDIALNLTHGTADVWVTIPEGWRNEEIAEKLENDLNIPRVEFLQLAKVGFMFPDTYLFPKEVGTETVVKKMRDNFNRQIQKIDPSILESGKKLQGLTLEEVVNLASIVEREAKFDQDRPLVAGILLKRMREDWPLEVDATLQYILGYDQDQKTWWRNNLTAEQLKLDSKYNTRKYKGLPPTAICNPGAEAVKSIVNPEESDYWFYLSEPNGTMHYAKTLEEHNENIERYLR